MIDAEQTTAVREVGAHGASIAETAQIFSMLADPARLRLLVVLSRRQMCVSDLATVCGQSESAISHHLRLLRAHRVVHSERSGRRVLYRLADAHVRILLDVAFAHIRHAQTAHPECEERPA